MNCSLGELATRHGTDKGPGLHNYTPVYEQLLAGGIGGGSVLEIGVGTGASLRMWADAFPDSRIFGIDLGPHDLKDSRIVTLRCDQRDAAGLRRIGEKYGPFALIVDDGCHLPDAQIVSFDALFPYVEDRGLYVVEDVFSSYQFPNVDMKGQAGLRNSANFMEYAKRLSDGLNDCWHDEPAHLRICEIRFFRSMVAFVRGAHAVTDRI